LNLIDTYAPLTYWNEPEVNNLDEAQNIIRKVAKKTNKVQADSDIDKLMKERLQLILDQIQQMLSA